MKNSSRNAQIPATDLSLHRVVKFALVFVISALVFAGVSPRAVAASTGHPHFVTLKWMPSTTPVVGYNVYRATKSGGPYKRVNRLPVNQLQYVDSDVRAGHTYFYVVTAVDSRKKESPRSKEIRATVPRS